jgi:hypothetical protein
MVKEKARRKTIQAKVSSGSRYGTLTRKCERKLLYKP